MGASRIFVGDGGFSRNGKFVGNNWNLIIILSWQTYNNRDSNCTLVKTSQNTNEASKTWKWLKLLFLHFDW